MKPFRFFIQELEQVNRDHNPLDYFSIRNDRKSLYTNIIKENLINNESLLNQLKDYVNDTLNLIDYDEELLKEFVNQKNILVEEQIKKFGIPDGLHQDDTYIFLQNKVTEIKNILKDTNRSQ
jgi:hypothetical protein